MKPKQISMGLRSFPILGLVLALLFLVCPPALAETADENVPDSPASPAAEESQVESSTPNGSETELSTDSEAISEPEATHPPPLPPVPTTPEAEDTRLFRRHLDFFGMNFGGEFYSQFFEEGIHHRPVVKADIQLLNFRMSHLYFTVIEVFPTFLAGIVGGGSRIGYRLPLRPDWRSELRIGMALGGGYLVIGGETVGAFRMEPNLEYVYSTKYGSVGFGIEVPIFFHRAQIIESVDSKYEHLRYTSIGVGVYFHFSVGRIELKRRERKDPLPESFLDEEKTIP